MTALDWVYATLAQVIFVSVGYVLYSAIRGGGRERATRVFGFSAALGFGWVGFFVFYLSLVGVLPRRSLILGMAVAAIVCAVVLHRTGRLVRVNWKWPVFRSGWAVLGAALTILGVAFVAWDTFAWPLSDWDGILTWAFKGKALYCEGVQSSWYFSDVSKNYSHLRYPLLAPGLMAATHAAVGHLNADAAKWPMFVVHVAFLSLLYEGLRRNLESRFSLLLTGLVAATPAVYHWAGSGKADGTLVMFTTAALVCFAQWMNEGRGWRRLTLGSVFLACAAFSKNEGQMIAVLVVAALCAACIWLGGWKGGVQALAAAAIVAALLAPFFLWARSIPSFDEQYASRLNWSVVTENLDRLPVILTRFMLEPFLPARWAATWLTLAVLLVMGRRALREAFACLLGFVLVMQLAAYVLVHVVTPYEYRFLMEITLDRLFLHVLPAAVLLMGVAWKYAFGRFAFSGEEPR